MYEQAPFCLRKISSVAYGLSPIKIHFSDYPKSLISRINGVYINRVLLLIQVHVQLLSCLFF